MANYVTKAEIARLAGLTRAAVSGKCKRGALPVMEDGTLDLDDPVVQDYVSKASGTRNGFKPGTRKRPDLLKENRGKPRTKKPVPPDPDDVTADEPLPEVPGYTGNENLDTFTGNELMDIERREKIRKLQIANRKAESEVIERDEVKAIMSAIDAIIQSQMRPLGTALAPEVASVAGASDPGTEIEITRLIDEGVERLLQNIKREFSSWISGGNG